MFYRLLLLFTIVPLVELIVLIRVARILGSGETIALVLVTGVLGAAFARQQGSEVFLKIRQAWQEGRMPGEEMIHGLLVLIGGLLLVTPGFLTDLVGLSLLFPLTRIFWMRTIISRLRKRMGIVTNGGDES